MRRQLLLKRLYIATCTSEFGLGFELMIIKCLNNVKEEFFVLFYYLLIVPLVIRAPIYLQFTMRRSMVETLVADGNSSLYRPVLQLVLAK